MPRSSTCLPRYRKHAASGQAVVTLGGRDHYLGPYGTQTSKTQYDRLVAEWLARGRQSAPTAACALTICELAARYWSHARQVYVRNGRPTAEQHHVKMTLRSLLALYRDTLVTEFGPVALRVVQGALVESGLARSTINARIARVKQMSKWAVAEELLPVEIYQALATVAGLRRGRSAAKETAPIQPVDDATVETTLPCLPEVVADMVRVQRLTGCRSSVDGGPKQRRGAAEKSSAGWVRFS